MVFEEENQHLIPEDIRPKHQEEIMLFTDLTGFQFYSLRKNFQNGLLVDNINIVVKLLYHAE